ncbi:MAG: PEP-CTERM sorting domain-containing protein [Akkermansiaceae bacterium]|nr:PEP-CTERM sorting domain-containing protein [Akkermansiaceae bacterium]
MNSPWVVSSNTASGDAKITDGHGIGHAGDPNGIGAVSFMDQGIDASVNIIHTANSYSLAAGTATTTMIMGWSAHPHTDLLDDGYSAGNEIFQIGLLSSSTGLMGVAGAESFYLAGIEESASLATNQTNVVLSMADTNGVLGSFNGGTPITFDSKDYHVFKLGMTPDLAGNVNVTLEMDLFISSGIYGTFTYGGNTNLGTISVANNVAKVGNMFPALGFKLEDSSKVSITGASFDTAPVPEPSSALLLFASSLLLIKRRR